MAISKTYLDKKNKNKMVMFGGGAEEGTDTTTRKKQKQLLANAMKRTSEWVFSQEIPSDVTVQAAGAKFSLHECGYIRKLVAEAQDADLSMITLSDIPEQARATDDGIYRAIDIYLKAHPSLNELERKKVCSVMDCQKLSREACAHAVQNQRLPIQIVVQVLYFEQQRLRNAMSGTFVEREVGRQSQKIKNSSAASTVHSPRDESVVLRLCQENQDLKLEIERLRMRLCDLEKERPSVKPGTGRPPQYKKKFWNSVSRKLGKLNPFMKLPD